jgi:aromatic-L-amino-acid decarboxylase
MAASYDQVPVQARESALDMSADEFRLAGHALIDQIAGFLGSIRERPVTRPASPEAIRELIGTGGLPERGRAADDLLQEVAPLLFDHSLHNGHPRFLGYISSAAAPIGALADLLAASINSNVAKWELSPLASEIESQTIRWIAEFIGYPVNCGGILVSGGNMANLLGFVAARKAMVTWNIRQEGLYEEPRRLTAYVSRGTHTWIDKAADVCGLGAIGIRWIETDAQQRMDIAALRDQIEADRRERRLPFLVVGTAGTGATGAIDPLREIAELCRSERLWMHVDGAYGAPAAGLPEAPADLRALALADSVALDPHKWLYSPLEAACVLTRDPRALPDALSFRPDYYRFEEQGQAGIDYYEYGLQNSRSFRALKVWLGLRQAGRQGYQTSIRDDIAVAKHLFAQADAHPEIEAKTLNLSIATFRYIPLDLNEHSNGTNEYLNDLNKAVLAETQRSGTLFLSNAVIDGDYFLRACCVNFRTSKADVEPIPEQVVAIGRRIDQQMRTSDAGSDPSQAGTPNNF